MTTRAWWLGIVIVTLAVLAHAAFPRYEWRAVSGYEGALIRVDRWTGHAQLGIINRATGGRWQPLR